MHHVGRYYVTLLLNLELLSRVKLCLVIPHIFKDYPKVRNVPKIFLRSFENVGPALVKNQVHVKLFATSDCNWKEITNWKLDKLYWNFCLKWNAWCVHCVCVCHDATEALSLVTLSAQHANEEMKKTVRKLLRTIYLFTALIFWGYAM